MKIKKLTAALFIAAAMIMLVSCNAESSESNGNEEVNNAADINGNGSEDIELEADEFEFPEYIIIQGEEFSTSLTNLELRNRHLTDADIEPLRYMTNLEYLDLTNNWISDISPLAGLMNLTGLALGGNEISDISPLAGLTKLRSLLLDGNQISDISALVDLTDLEHLAWYC